MSALNGTNDLPDEPEVNPEAKEPHKTDAASEDLIERPTIEMLEREINRQERNEEFFSTIWKILRAIIVTAAAATLVSNFLISAYRVSGRGMAPTLNDKEIVVARKASSVKKGDVIVFYYNNKIMIKRVVATASDWVDIDENGVVTVNGEVLDEPYIDEKSLGECDIELPFQVLDGYVFVLSDRRADMQDSRTSAIGPVDTTLIVGKVMFKVWPLAEIELVK